MRTGHHTLPLQIDMASDRQSGLPAPPVAVPGEPDSGSSPCGGEGSRIQPIGLVTSVIAVGLAALWGGNVVGLKIGLATFPPLWSAFWRMLTGIVVVAAWARWRGISLVPQTGELRFLVILGMAFFVQISAMNVGVNWTSPAYGVVLISSYPVFANLISHFVVAEDRLSWRRVCGLSLALGGICVVFLGSPSAEIASRPLLGNLIATLSAFLLGARIVYTQRLVQAINPVRAVTWQMLTSLPAFLLAAAVTEQAVLKPVDTEAVLAILYQGVVVAGLCFIAWTSLLTKHSPGSLSVFAFPTPLFGVVASAWFYQEPIRARLWLGLAVVSAGVLLATRSRENTAPREDRERAAR